MLYFTSSREKRYKTISKYQSIAQLNNVVCGDARSRGKFIIKKRKKEKKEKENINKKNKTITWKYTHKKTAKTYTNGFIYCLKCSGIFYNKHIYEKNVNNFHQVGFRCNVCNGLFKSKVELSIHKNTTHRNTYYCTLCDSSFTEKENFDVHKNWFHTGFEQMPDELFGKDVDLKFLYAII